jgi:hypothetical protein
MDAKSAEGRGKFFREIAGSAERSASRRDDHITIASEEYAQSADELIDAPLVWGNPPAWMAFVPSDHTSCDMLASRAIGTPAAARATTLLDLRAVFLSKRGPQGLQRLRP